MSFEIIPTQNFRAEAKKLSKKYFPFKEDIRKVIEKFVNNPTLGNEVFKKLLLGSISN